MHQTHVEFSNDIEDRIDRTAVGIEAMQASLDTTVMVNARRLDGLVDMVGELVMLQSLIQESPLLARISDERLSRNLAHLGRITAGLQRGAQSITAPPQATLEGLLMASGTQRFVVPTAAVQESRRPLRSDVCGLQGSSSIARFRCCG